jgi:hypothetical protein
MGTLGDLLVLGEGPSVVADAGIGLLARACELLWSRAVAATGAGPHVIREVGVLESEIKLCFLE